MTCGIQWQTKAKQSLSSHPQRRRVCPVMGTLSDLLLEFGQAFCPAVACHGGAK